MTDLLRSRLPQLIEEILGLDARLAVVVPHRDEGRESGGGGRVQKPHSPAPWNSAAALCRMDLHALAREVEGEWRAAAGFPARERGGSDANTRSCLEAVAQLAYAQGVECDNVLRSGVRELERWTRSARMVLGDMERPRRLRTDGRGELACPGCGLLTLRLWAIQGMIRCVNPQCADDDGRKWTGMFEYDGGTFCLTWQDGSILREG